MLSMKNKRSVLSLMLSAALSTFVLNSCSTGQEIKKEQKNVKTTHHQQRDEYAQHSLAFDNDPKARKIHVDEKTYGKLTDAIFRDGYGREATFRGWSVSGAVKLKSMKFMPFKNAKDAAQSFGIMGQKMGANQIRFTIAWEGVHPEPDVIDYAYLEAVTAQMREAIKHGMYIVVDFHSDLYTRHTFRTNSLDTGNGAPEWIVKNGNHGKDRCGVPCLFTWGAHKLSDEATRSAMRAFWLNSPIKTTKGTRYVQDEFLWQLGKVAEYLDKNLSSEERDYILGIEPLNEPFDGGIKKLGLKNYSEFDNKILWPFYQRTRKAMDKNGMADKLVYAEPLVFWYTTTGIVAPATGYGFLDYSPGKRFVFAPHLYDQGRMGVKDTTVVENAAYLHKLDEVRQESRRLGTPMFLGEYGMWNTGKGKQDTVRVINASIQALETSNGQRQDTESKKVDFSKASRFADFYTPFINGAQWHWNHYYGNSQEYQNDNPNKLITEFDAWNRENFSVVKDFSSQYTQVPEITERSYPRRIQGDLMHFAYHAKAKDRDNKKLDWHSIRVDLDGEFKNREYFRDRKFSILVWRGRRADVPTEVYLPASFKPESTTVITEAKIQKGLTIENSTKNTKNEILLTKDPKQRPNSGNRLLIWDDIDHNESDESIHYVIAVEHTDDMDREELQILQRALNQKLLVQKASAVYLPSRMTFSAYPKDKGSSEDFQMINQSNKMCLDVEKADKRDGTTIIRFKCSGKKMNQRWRFNKSSGNIISRLNDKCVTAVNSKLGSGLQLTSCNHLSQAQKFIQTGNGTWSLKSNPTLRIDSSSDSDVVRLSKARDDQDSQKWMLQY